MRYQDMLTYDATLIGAINLSNQYQGYLINRTRDINSAFRMITYMLENEIDYSVVDAWCNMLSDMLTELSARDYDLQYNEPDVIDGKVVQKRYDTVITFDLLQTIENMDMTYVYERPALIDQLGYTAIQLAVNALKFQTKYGLSVLEDMRRDEGIWGIIDLMGNEE